MEAFDIGFALTGVMAAAAAAVFGTTFGISFATRLRRRSAAASVVAPGSKARAMLLMKEGVPALKPLARWLFKIERIKQTSEYASMMLEEEGVEAESESVVSVALAASLGALAIVSVATGSIVAGAACFAFALVGLYVLAHNKAESRTAELREQVPEAMRSMSTCFRSGLSLVQTMKHVSNECGSALGKLFDVSARRLELGASTGEALSVMRGNSQLPELAFVAVALDVQHQSGGSIAPVLESARDSVVGELELIRSLRVQTAQARLSASIVTIMPFLLVALFSLVSPDFLSPFFSSIAGMAILCVAIAMQAAGVFLVRKMLQIDGE